MTRKRKDRDPAEALEDYTAERAEPVPSPAEIARCVNLAHVQVRHITHHAALLKQAEVAAALGVSEKSIERYRLEKGLPAYRKTDPNTKHRVWYLCGAEVWLWLVDAGLSGLVEMPGPVRKALKRWEYWHAELAAQGLVDGPADQARYVESMEHAAFMGWYWYEDLGEEGPCPWLIEEEDLLDAEEIADRSERALRLRVAEEGE